MMLPDDHGYGGPVHGREPAVRDDIVALSHAALRRSSQGRSVTIGDVTAALRADFVGTHTGEFRGIPPAGAALRCRTACSTT